MSERAPQPHAIMWDLDETMGQFKPYWLEHKGHVLPPALKERAGIRYGLTDLLTDFSPQNGFVHLVTTASTEEFANTVLERTTLLPHFQGVYGRGTVVPETVRGEGKYYKNVAEIHGYSGDQIPEKMLVIGNDPKDQPLDVEELVFMELGPSWRMDALVIREIVTTLLEKGDESFRDGFQHVYDAADVVQRDEPDEERVFHLNDDIQLRLEYRNAPEVSPRSVKRVPVITDVIAPLYMKDGVKV